MLPTLTLHVFTLDHNITIHFHTICSHLKEFLETLKEECHWLHSMTAKVCARCTFCSGKNIKPCIRHEEKECRHHDCAHYISFESKLCCKPGCPLPQEPLKPWIQVSLFSAFLSQFFAYLTAHILHIVFNC